MQSQVIRLLRLNHFLRKELVSGGSTLGCIFILMVTSCFAVVPPRTRGIPTGLASPVKIAHYTVRPPEGMTHGVAQRVYSKVTDTKYYWNGSKRPDKTRLSFDLEIVSTKPGHQFPEDPQIALNAVSQGFAKQHHNYVESAVTVKEINGVEFSRFYWKGIWPKTGKEDHGFLYMYVAPHQITTIRAADAEPYNRVTLPLCEKAAFTLRFH